jgi:hypothetical protein
MTGPKQSIIDAMLAQEEDIQSGLLWHLLYFYPGPYAMLYAYLDESDPNFESVFCVAGVLYTREGLERLDAAWGEELRAAGITRFHTVEYAHLRGEFRDRDRASANALYIRLLGIIKENASGSVVVYSIPRNEFDVFRDEKWRRYSVYTTCSYICIGLLSSFAALIGDRQIDCTIEAGYQKMGELCTLIQQQRERGGLPSIASHNFASKEIRGLQSADVFAYEYGKRVRDRLDGSERPIRQSLNSLIENEPKYKSIVLNEAIMAKFYGSLRP